MTTTVTILGCGYACGVPSVGPYWGACDPNNPKNRRTRPSILIHTHGKYILIDSSPDLRYQLLREDIPTIDAVLYTHDHSDHAHGIGDLGPIQRRTGQKIPLYASQETLEKLKHSFGYAFASDIAHYIPFFTSHIIEPYQSFDLFGLRIQPFLQDHGYSSTLGFRIHNFAYSTDVIEFPDKSHDYLRDLDIWLVDCLKREYHPTHSHLSKTLGWIDQFQPKHAILTHMSPQLDYAVLKNELPPTVEPAYDGMTFTI